MVGNKISKKIGAAPGTPVFVGEKKVENITFTVMEYTPQQVEFNEEASLEEVLAARDSQPISWINIYGVHDIPLLERIGEHFHLHPLVIEDIVHTGQRPKLEVYDDYLFIVLKMLWFNEDENTIDSEQISLICGANYVLCFQERKGDIFTSLRERIQTPNNRLRIRGTDYLTYAIMDVVVDHYFIILEKIGDYLEELDEEVLGTPDRAFVQKIHRLKRDMILLRKNTWPIREVVTEILRGDISYFQEATIPFLRDLYDHTIRVIESLEGYRDFATGLMDMYMSSVSNRMNEIMKVLTIIATIFIPLSFLAGIYGMNFDTSVSPFNMPELKLPYGYPLFWLVVIVLGGSMLWYFRKKEWL